MLETAIRSLLTASAATASLFHGRLHESISPRIITNEYTKLIEAGDCDSIGTYGISNYCISCKIRSAAPVAAALQGGLGR